MRYAWESPTPVSLTRSKIESLPPVPMPLLIRPVVALLVSAAILFAGNGLQAVLLPLRADFNGFTGLEIGLLGSSYYLGLIVGCLLTPLIISRVGHIRAFVAFTATATIAPLIHAIWSEPYLWWAMRALNGLCFAGLAMGIESWLNGASTPETRGRVLSAYTFLNLTVVTAGIQMLGLSDPKGFELFSLTAILYSLAAVPVALTSTPAPAVPHSAKLRLGWLATVSPAAVAGCFLTGLANAAFWSLSPVYAKANGLPITGIITFLTVSVLAGALTQWPVGWYSDRIGRRALLVVAATLAACAGAGLNLAGSAEHLVLLTMGGVYGAAAFPIYTLCVAHANDLVHKKRAVEVSSGLLMTFSLGAICGPLVASWIMSRLGPGALFLHSAAAHAIIALVMATRIYLRPELPEETKEIFVAVPSSTQVVFELDPRGEPEEPGSGMAAGDGLTAAATPDQSSGP